MRAHSRGIKLIGATLTPFGNETFMADAWNPTREKHRVTVNKWIRESGAFDGVADFDAALRDPEIHTDAGGRRLRRWAAPERQRVLQDGRRDRPRPARMIRRNRLQRRAQKSRKRRRHKATVSNQLVGQERRDLNIVLLNHHHVAVAMPWSAPALGASHQRYGRYQVAKRTARLRRKPARDRRATN